MTIKITANNNALPVYIYDHRYYLVHGCISCNSLQGLHKEVLYFKRTRVTNNHVNNAAIKLYFLSNRHVYDECSGVLPYVISPSC